MLRGSRSRGGYLSNAACTKRGFVAISGEEGIIIPPMLEKGTNTPTDADAGVAQDLANDSGNGTKQMGTLS
jgi:hypothetical protein